MVKLFRKKSRPATPAERESDLEDLAVNGKNLLPAEKRKDDLPLGHPLTLDDDTRSRQADEIAQHFTYNEITGNSVPDSLRASIEVVNGQVLCVYELPSTLKMYAYIRDVDKRTNPGYSRMRAERLKRYKQFFDCVRGKITAKNGGTIIFRKLCSKNRSTKGKPLKRALLRIPGQKHFSFAENFRMSCRKGPLNPERIQASTKKEPRDIVNTPRRKRRVLTAEEIEVKMARRKKQVREAYIRYAARQKLIREEERAGKETLRKERDELRRTVGNHTWVSRRDTFHQYCAGYVEGIGLILGRFGTYYAIYDGKIKVPKFGRDRSYVLIQTLEKWAEQNIKYIPQGFYHKFPTVPSSPPTDSIVLAVRDLQPVFAEGRLVRFKSSPWKQEAMIYQIGGAKMVCEGRGSTLMFYRLDKVLEIIAQK